MEGRQVRVKWRASEELAGFCVRIVEVGDIKENPLLKRVERQELEVVLRTDLVEWGLLLRAQVWPCEL
ncbi:hypothetical protein R0K19_28895, partial [Bacillus sp. SIMBA_161]